LSLIAPVSRFKGNEALGLNSGNIWRTRIIGRLAAINLLSNPVYGDDQHFALNCLVADPIGLSP
jgi:hypothetical protein